MMRIAIIGAGPSGLIAARILSQISSVTIYERRLEMGGVWNLGPPMYDDLYTNIPGELMSFSNSLLPGLFPSRREVLRYLTTTFSDLRGLVKFGTEVIEVRKDGKWRVRYIKDDKEGVDEFDKIVVANGHHSTPRIPSLPGLESALSSGFVIHSKYFEASKYSDKKVCVVGNGPSAVDIITHLEISNVVQSSRSGGIDGVEQVGRLMGFGDGYIVTDTERIDVDKVILATGYCYSLPFLPQSTVENTPIPDQNDTMGEMTNKTDDVRRIITDGESLHGLYLSLTSIADPSLAFLATQTSIVPFPLAEAQCCYLARLWSHRLTLPTSEKMRKWEEEQERRKGRGRGKMKLGHPEDGEYIHFLAEECRKSDERYGTGLGVPCEWYPRRSYLREHTAELRREWLKTRS